MNGNYAGPQILSSTSIVVVRAPSAADASKFATASLTVTSNFTLQLSGPSSIATRSSTTIVATLTPIPNSNLNSTLSWRLSGTGCGGSWVGKQKKTTTQFYANNVKDSSANNMAPQTDPSPQTGTITRSPTAATAKRRQL